MGDSVQILYKELKQHVTAAKLDDTIKQIISLYRAKNFAKLRPYAEKANLTINRNMTNAAFARLINIYHPDKLACIHHDIDAAYDNKDIDLLRQYRNVYLTENKSETIDVDYEEEYDYAEEERYNTTIVDDDVYDDHDVFEEEYGTCLTFLDVINRELSRILGYEWDIGDLRSLEGELHLQHLNLYDLEGIEVCVHLSGLDLTHNKLRDVDVLQYLVNLEFLYISENQVEDISFVSELINLREIDLSFNQVADISPLLALTELQYVNLVGNPIRNNRSVAVLTSRGVTVVI